MRKVVKMMKRRVVQRMIFISKKSLNFENFGELWGTLEYSGVLKVQRFFADVALLLVNQGDGIQ